MNRAELINELVRKEPDTTIRQYLDCVAEIEGSAVVRFVPEKPKPPILTFTYPYQEVNKSSCGYK